MSDNTFSSYEVRVRAIEAVQRGLSKQYVASAYGVNRTTLYRWLEKFDKNGYEGLLRQEGSGRPRLLEEISETDVTKIVPDFQPEFTPSSLSQILPFL